MSIRYEISVLATHILAKAEGSYAHKDVMHLFEAAFTAASTNKKSKILIDVRNVTGNPSTRQRFDFGDGVATLYKQTLVSTVALVAIFGNEPFINSECLGETVAINRAVPVKTTTDMREATDWLEIPAGES